MSQPDCRLTMAHLWVYFLYFNDSWYTLNFLQLSCITNEEVCCVLLCIIVLSGCILASGRNVTYCYAFFHTSCNYTPPSFFYTALLLFLICTYIWNAKKECTILLLLYTIHYTLYSALEVYIVKHGSLEMHFLFYHVE